MSRLKTNFKHPGISLETQVYEQQSEISDSNEVLIDLTVDEEEKAECMLVVTQKKELNNNFSYPRLLVESDTDIQKPGTSKNERLETHASIQHAGFVVDLTTGDGDTEEMLGEDDECDDDSDGDVGDDFDNSLVVSEFLSGDNLKDTSRYNPKYIYIDHLDEYNCFKIMSQLTDEKPENIPFQIFEEHQKLAQRRKDKRGKKTRKKKRY